jgi:hypothetical protein
MPITSSDLVLYNSANMPTDDTSTSGGAIDTLRRPVFTQMTANAQLALVSSGSDTRQVTITGRRADGTYTSETVTLNGTTEVLTTNTYERLLRAEASATHASNTITIRQGSGGSTLATIPPNERGVTAMFINSASESSAVNRYEKVFFRNNHASLTLQSAKVTLTADPASKIFIGLATSKDDSGSVTNRRTAPSGITFVDDNVAVDVPGGTLEAGSAIGVWVRQSLAANDSPVRSTFTLQVSGTTV